MSGWTLGIDFGTTFTVGVVVNNGETHLVDTEADGSSRMPSAVVLDETGTLTVGRAAVHQATFTPDRYEPTPKRWVGEPEMLLGNDYVPVVDVISSVLGRVADEGRKVAGGTPPGRLVLTHPADWASTRCGVLRSAAAQAGLGDVELLPEPVAAAARIAGVRTKPGQYVAVYDFGGGTFDAAVLHRDADGFSLAGPPGGCDPLGGEDMDRRIIEYLGTTRLGEDPQWPALVTPPDEKWLRASLELRDQVRRSKEQLSAATVCQLWIPGLECRVQLSRDELVDLIRDDVARTVQVTADTIAAAGLEPEELAGIFLVGGSSRIPLVADQVWRRFGQTPSVQDDPKTVVALGATGRRVSRRAESTEAVWQSRLATVTTTAFWSAGATSQAHLTISDGDARATLTDEHTDCRTAEELAQAQVAVLAEHTGYEELALDPGSVLGHPGVRRRYSRTDNGVRTVRVAQYVVLRSRAIIAAAAEDDGYLLEAVSLAAPTLPIERFHEMPFTVRRGSGWTLHERMVLVRNQTGHRVTIESFDLPPRTTPLMWAGQRTAPYQSAGWQSVSTRSGRMLGRPSSRPTSGIGDVARLLDGVPAQIQTLRQSTDSGTNLVRIWTSVVDDRGYSVITTLPAGDSGFKLLAAHALLRPRPGAAPEPRGWRAAVAPVTGR